jgi:hypothetical protein
MFHRHGGVDVTAVEPGALDEKKVPDAIDRNAFGWAGVASALVAIVASVTTIVLGLKDLLDLEGPGWAIVLAWFAVALVIGSLASVFVLQLRHNRYFQWLKRDQERKQAALETEYRRRAAVDLALPSLHRAHHLLRDSTYAVVRGETASAQDRLAASVAEMATVFSMITGQTCRASIKLLQLAADAPEEVDPVRGAEYLYVTTLCRHDHTNPPSTRGPDPLVGNTDFMQVWDIESPGTCFISNDLDSVDPYENSHRKGRPKATWAYNATMVWPIQKAEIESDDDPDGLGFDMLGFFCIDSLTRNIFRYDNDFHIGAGYADALYTHLSIRNLVADSGKLRGLSTGSAEEPSS